MPAINPGHLKSKFGTVRKAAILGLTIALFPAVALAAPPSPLDPASPGTRSIANLHATILWIAAAVFAIVCGLLIYSLVRFRRKSADEPEPDQSFHGSAVLETIWTIIPVGILLVILVLTFQTLQDTNPERETDMTVSVTGKQWLWEVQYPAYNIKLTNEMRVPMNKDIKVELTSADVIHSFWVPQLTGKKDAVPGYLSTAWFKADKLGTFQGQCAEYCGLGHAQMSIEVIVMDQNSFDIWAASTAEKQANASAQGELLFTSNCSSCHTVNGQGGQIGPELTNVYAEKGEDYVRESILTPNAVIAPACPTGPCPTGVMPQNFGEQLSEDDLNNIVSYLREASGVEE
jgi:cytochrome c oxidase subunit 2